jgi:spermidine/putrescine transport system substrate-binding protein
VPPTTDHDTPRPGAGELLASWLREIADGHLDRRQFLLRATALGLAGSSIATLLAACGSSDDSSGKPVAMDTTLPATLEVFNWAAYISPKTLRDFGEKYGLKVELTTYGSNEKLVKAIDSGAGPYDVIFPTDSFVTTLINAGQVQPLDMDLIPNFVNVTDPVFRKPAFDPETDGHKYSVPYMFGTTGFIARLDRVKTVDDTWEMLYDPAFDKKITMLDGSREVLGPPLFLLGSDPNTTNQATLDKATAMAVQQKPMVVEYDSTDVAATIASGRPLTEAWDGDAVAAIGTLGMSKIKYVLPREGFSAWADGVCIPENAPSPYAAHLFLDYLLDPGVAAQNANYTGYQPVIEAADPMIKSLVQRAMRPTPEVIARGVVSKDLGDFNKQFEAAWETVQNA